MKLKKLNKYILILIGLITYCSSFGQPPILPSPDTEWRVVDHPTLVIDCAFEQTYTPPGGIPRTPGVAQNKEDSGEDWWYDIERFQDEEEHGYIVSGYATWINIQLDETLAGGLFENLDGGADCNRPVMHNEIISQKLATIAKYSEDGTMIWCKPICKSDEGAISITPTSDGGYVFTGWGKATISSKDALPMMYNPRITDPGFNMTDASVPMIDRKAKMIVGKIDSEGALLWLNAYGAYDIGGSHTASDVLGVSAIGYDILEFDGDKIRVVGHSQDLNDPFFDTSEGSGLYTKILVIDLDKNGFVIDGAYNQRLIGQSGQFAQSREIEPNLIGDAFYITGFQRSIASKSDAILFKIDLNMNQLRFGSDYWDGGSALPWNKEAAVRYAFSGQGNNIGWDVKVLKNGKVAWAFIEKCQGGLFSGNNIGKGRVFLYEDEVDGDVEFINLQSINTYGFTDVRAFDLKMGLISTEDGGFACVTSIKGDPKSGNAPSDILENLKTQIGYDCVNGEDIDGDGDIENGDEIFYFSEMWNTDAYVAKFNGGGELLWDKKFDADDGPASYYPGDYKEQECVYRIVEGYDGGLTVVGNASFNKDDYYIAKIKSDCNTEYHIEPDGDNKIYIASDQIWDATPPGGILKVRGEVHIKSGYSLTISGIRVEFADSQKSWDPTKIIVEPGAKLILENNAVLSALSNCGDQGMWEGIEVWGNSSVSQSFSNQGWVVMHNSTIEHAHVAVDLMRPGYWDMTGGVIQSYNSTFQNNRRSIAFTNYVDVTITGIEKPNRSLMRNVDFIWNDDFRHKPLNHVSLYKVYGVSFSGCHFSDDRTGDEFTSPYLEGTSVTKCGIQSIDAQYYVNAACNDIGGCTGDIEMEPWNPSSFNNLDFGIHASNSSSIYPINVSRSIFTNNLYGIQTSGLFNPQLIYNRFYYTDSNNSYIDNDKFGVKLISSQNLAVEENDFINTTGDFTTIGECIGIVCSDLGESNEMIRKNTFTGMNVGNRAEGRNRGVLSPGYPDGSIGLSYECNQNMDNNYDFEVLDHIGETMSSSYGIKIDMGSNAQSAGNTFSSPAIFHFFNETDHVLKYYYKPGAIYQHPFLIFNVDNYPGGDNSCDTNFPYNGSGVAGSRSAFDDINSQLVSVQQKYQRFIDAGEKPSDDFINRFNTLLSQRSNVLIAQFSKLNGGVETDLNQLEEWIRISEDKLYRMDLIDLYIQQDKLSKALSEVNLLESEIDNLPDHMNQEINDFIRLKDIIIGFKSSNISGYSISENTKTQIRQIAVYGNGLAKYQAQEFLCFFFDECVSSITKSSTKNGEKIAVENTVDSKVLSDDQMIKIYPNPAKEMINLEVVDLGLNSNFKIEIYSGHGQKIKSLKGSKKNTSIDISTLKSGIYVVRVYNENFSYSKKIIKL